MTIYVEFSRARSIFAIGSKFIAIAEARNYSHAYIRYICPITKEMMVFQASHGMVHEINYEHFKKDNIPALYYELEVNDVAFLRFFKFMQKNKGKHYSRLQICWFTLKKLLQIHKWPDRIYNLIKNGDSEFICSELATMVVDLVDNAIDMYIIDYQLDQISPSDLDTILSESGYRRIVLG